jgi:hypothetical protein
MGRMDIEKRARAIARRIVGEMMTEALQRPGIAAVRVRTYSDAAAYALLAPEGHPNTWALHQAINRHIMSGFDRLGIVVEFVVLSGEDYRSWLRDRDDTAPMRDRYVAIMESAMPSFTSEPRTLH